MTDAPFGPLHAPDYDDWERIITELNARTDQELTSVALNEYIREINQESDRGVMILAPTAIEDAMKAAFAILNRRADVAGEDRPVGKAGLKGTFRQRSEEALRLDLITQQHLGQVDIYREIRNMAAHSHTPVSFDDPLIVAAFGHLIEAPIVPVALPDGGTGHMPLYAIMGRDGLRTQFIMGCGFIAGRIMRAVQPDAPEVGGHRHRMLLAAQGGQWPLPAQDDGPSAEGGPADATDGPDGA